MLELIAICIGLIVLIVGAFLEWMIVLLLCAGFFIGGLIVILLGLL